MIPPRWGPRSDRGAAIGTEGRPRLIGMNPDRSDDPRLLAQRRLEGMVGRGELTLAEFSDRAAAIWSATCPAELDAALSDLPACDPALRPFDDPAGHPSVASGPATAVSYADDVSGRRSISVFGDLTRVGRWDLTRGFRGTAVLGDVFLDLREAVIDAPSTRIHVRSVLGDIRVLLPPGVTVAVGGSRILGGLKVDETHSVGGGGPHIDLVVDSLLGDVKVRYLPAGERVPTMWKWF